MFEIGQLTRLPLGYVGENGTRTISIDMKAWLDEYPGALVMIQVIRPVDHYKYPAAYTKTDGVIHWTVDGTEVMYAGKGFAQISLYNPDTKQEYKSRVVGTVVADSIDGFNDILLEETDPASKWVNRVLEAAESAEASKNDAANSKEEAAAAIAIVATQKNEALIAIQNEGAVQVASVNDAGTQQAQFVEAKGEEVLGMIPEDYAELSKNVATLTEDIARNTAPAIIPTATGEVVSVSDSANRPLAGLRLYGKTTQATTTGKNLLPNTVSTTVNNGITFTSNTDGTITANGTSLADWDAYCIVGTATLVVGEKYLLTGCPSGGGFGIGLDGTGIYDWGDGIEFTAETANYTPVLIVSKNKTISNVVFKPMIRLASVTDATYEPYTGGIPSPNPNYPQELVNVGAGGSIGVKAMGKNLLNASSVININSETSDESRVFAIGANLPAGTYTFSIGGYTPDNNGAQQLAFYYMGLDGTEVYPNIQTHIHNTHYAATFTAASGINWCAVYVPVADDTYTVRNLMLEVGSVATTYEPYADGGSLTASTPNGLPGIPVSSGGNYTDSNGQQWVCDEIDYGRGVYVQMVKQSPLSQVESWSKWGNNWYNHNYLRDSASTYNGIIGMCTHAQRDGNPIDAGYIVHSDIVNGRGVGIQISNAAEKWGFTGTTPEEFKAFVDAKDIKLVYACVPVETPIPASELAAYRAMTSQYPNTTVYNDAGAEMQVDYIADTQRYIDNKLAAIAAATL